MTSVGNFEELVLESSSPESGSVCGSRLGKVLHRSYVRRLRLALVKGREIAWVRGNRSLACKQSQIGPVVVRSVSSDGAARRLAPT